MQCATKRTWNGVSITSIGTPRSTGMRPTSAIGVGRPFIALCVWGSIRRTGARKIRRRGMMSPNGGDRSEEEGGGGGGGGGGGAGAERGGDWGGGGGGGGAPPPPRPPPTSHTLKRISRTS